MKLARRAIVACTLAGVATHLHAEDDGIRLEELTVTGERIERNLLDTTTSVNVQSELDLSRSGDLDIQQVFRRVANVAATGSGVQSFDFSIRGISTDGVGGAGQEGLASIFIDDINTTRVQNARGLSSLFDVERVEILRGPQSTNRGKNSLAGAVMVTTKDPEFEFDTNLRAEYADYNSYQLAVAHTGPITDELAYRITVDHQHTDGFIDNKALGEDDFLESESTSGRLKLLYQPASFDGRFLFSYTRHEGDTNNMIESYEPENEEFVSYNPYRGQMKSNQDLFSLHADFGLTESWSLQSVTTYNQFDSDDFNSNYALTLPDDDQVWHAMIEQEEFTQELKGTFKGERTTTVVGLYYSEFKETNIRDGIGLVGFDTPLGVQDVDILFDSPSDIETIAAFAEVDYQITDRLKATFGARIESLKFDLITDGLITLQPSGFPFQDLTLLGDKDQDVFLPKLGLNYALTADQSIGFSYSEGYRPGGVDLDIFAGTGATEYDSEFTKNYELSYKSYHLDRKLSLNANLFYIDWEDMQTSGSAQIRSGTYNAGEATVYGGELEVRWAPNSLGDVYFSAGHSNTNFDEFVTGGGSTDFTDNEFAFSPKYTVSIGGYLYLNDLTLGAEASYRDKYFDSIDNTYEVDDLTLVNLSAAYNWNELQLRLYANNIFDEVVATRRSNIVEGESLAALTDPRLVGMRVSYAF